MQIKGISKLLDGVDIFAIFRTGMGKRVYICLFYFYSKSCGVSLKRIARRARSCLVARVNNPGHVLSLAHVQGCSRRLRLVVRGATIDGTIRLSSFIGLPTGD